MFHQKYPDIRDPQYLVCGRIHIRKFTTIFTAIVILLAIIGQIFGKNDLLQISAAVVSIFTQLLVIYADKSEKAWAYLPFLIFNGIIVGLGFAIIGLVVLLVLFVLFLIAIGKIHFSDELSVDNYDSAFLPEIENFGDALWHITVLGTLLLILTLFTFYHWNLVHRARKYMIQEVLSGNTKQTVQNIPQFNDNYDFIKNVL